MRKVASSEDYFATTAIKRSLKQKAVRGGTMTAMSQVVKFGISVGSTAILARLLSPEDYGLVAMVTVITGFIANLNHLGLSTATVQFEEVDHDQVSTLFWLNATAGTGMALLVVLLAPVLSWFYSEPKLVWITVALAPGFVFLGLSVQHQALLNRQMRFRALAVTEIAAAASGSSLAIACAVLGFGYKSLVAAQLTTGILSLLLLWWFCTWRPGAPGQLKRVYPLLRFGGHMTGFQTVNYFSRNGDNFLIGRFHGSQELGLYSRAYNLLLLPLNQIISPIAAVAIPALSRVKGEQFRTAYLRIARVSCVLTMPFVAFTIGTADYIIDVFLGNQWHQASNIFAWLGVVGLVQPIAGTTGWVFVGQGRTREQFHVGLINGTLSILAFVAGLPWGGIGVAAAYAVSGVVIRTPLAFWFAGREGAVRTGDFYAVSAPCVAASVTGLALTLGLRSIAPMTPFTGIPAGAITTAVGFLAVMLALPQGRQGLRDVIDVIQTARRPETAASA